MGRWVLIIGEGREVEAERGEGEFFVVKIL